MAGPRHHRPARRSVRIIYHAGSDQARLALDRQRLSARPDLGHRQADAASQPRAQPSCVGSPGIREPRHGGHTAAVGPAVGLVLEATPGSDTTSVTNRQPISDAGADANANADAQLLLEMPSDPVALAVRPVDPQPYRRRFRHK